MPTLLGKACKFVVHVPSKHPDQPDVHLIKETLVYDDNTQVPNIVLKENFQRSFWLTHPSKRNHKQKKEWEDLENVIEYRCTESQLRDKLASLLGVRSPNVTLRELTVNPYVYGTNIPSTSIIKKLYQDQYPNIAIPHTVATFDIETDVIHGTGQVLMATVVFNEQVYCVIDKTFLVNYSSPMDMLQTVAKRELKEYIETYKLNIVFHIANDEIDTIRQAFLKVHEWMPDFLAIWNMDFDIPRILDRLSYHKVDPKTILCDPSLPEEFRLCKYHEGIKKKITASGKVQPINPAAQWHTLVLTASFYVIDAMCSFKQIRTGQQERSSYSLDAILNEELSLSKLKFEEASEYDGLRWHQVMQSRYPAQYVAYNIFDSQSMQMLNNKTKDLSFTLPGYAGITDFSRFNSQPTRIADALHFYLLDNGCVIGSTGKERDKKKTVTYDEDGDVIDDVNLNPVVVAKTLGLDGWIVTLPPHLSVLGIRCITEDSTIPTNIRGHVYDSDEVSAYPSATEVANVSKATTRREIIAIEGVPESVFRRQNLNLVLGQTNAIEYSCSMFNLPKPTELLELFN